MSRVQKEIDSLLQGIRNYQEVAGVEATREAEEILRGIESDLVRLETPSAYRSHLLQYVKQQRRRHRLSPDDEQHRSAVLCDCSNPYCRLKRGKLPPAVTAAETIDEGITQFQASHGGDGAVLSEAQNEWIDMTGEVRSELRRALSALKRDGNEPTVTEDDDDADEEYMKV